ncbi:Flp pilus assembly protein TadG [Catenulispora sp. GP43]|uniref:pilus assembly protein TadG-related protein n=1 Tax=Catenulispora sp. GP43 TaxID=3156263 RepID=UPI003517AB3F
MTVLAVLLVPVLLLASGLVLDGGAALSTKDRVLGEASEAARAGADALDVLAYRQTGHAVPDPVRARNAAERYLAATGDHYTVTVSADSVSVSVTADYRTQLLNLGGLDVIHVAGHATAHPVTSDASRS